MNTRKSFLHKSLLLSSLASLGIAAAVGVASAATNTTTSQQPAHHFQGHRHPGARGAMASPFMRAIHQLNLTDEQRQSIRTVLQNQRQQAQANAGVNRPDIEALANPGDPNYAAAVTAAKTAAANAIDRRSAVEQQIYGLLTPEQQAQLPKVLADMKTRMEQRHDKMKNG